MTSNLHSAMKIKDLKVGQTLVRATWSGGFRSRPSAVEEYIVTKILKTRLVLQAKGGQTLRVLVTSSRYYDDGVVKQTAEGQSAYSNYDVILFTADDPGIAEHVAEIEVYAAHDKAVAIAANLTHELRGNTATRALIAKAARDLAVLATRL